MKKIGLVLLLVLCTCIGAYSSTIEEMLVKLYSGDYKTLPEKGLLQMALTGYLKLKQNDLVDTDKHIITIVDFAKASDKKRMWVIDLEKLTVLYHCYVAHGKNTGEKYAKIFSNRPNSNMSSLGFYTTGKTYYGKHGLSLRLHGRERGFNDNAFSRAVVMHTADYVSEEFIKRHGRLGRSFGCPALSKKVGFEVIELIREGTCLFIYYPDQDYINGSQLLNDEANFHTSVY